MERVAEVTGIREDLTKVFDGNKELVNAIITLAYFPMSGKGTYDHLAAWMRITKTPYEGDLSSPNITILTQSITEQNRMDLFRYGVSYALFQYLFLLNPPNFRETCQ